MKDNKIGDFLAAAIIASGKSQAQIAEECGYAAHNNISMLKSGKMQFPVSKISDFAEALNVDETALFRIVMQSRYPEIYAMYARNAEPITQDERLVLEAYRKEKQGKEYSKDLASMVAEEFVEKATKS